MSDQELVDWIRENRSDLGIELSDDVSVHARDFHINVKEVMGVSIRIECADPLCGGDLDSPIMGLTTGDQVELFPSAFEAGHKDLLVVNEAGDTVISAPKLSRAESAILTFGHEAAHTRGIDVVGGITYHPNAERAGLNAVNRFREIYGK